MLLLRMIAGIPVVGCAITALFTGPGSAVPWAHVIAAAGGSLLLVGIWTPIGGALQALAEACLAFWDGHLDTTRLLYGAVAVSLVMIGPGAWSLDARLYGRKRIEVRGKSV